MALEVFVANEQSAESLDCERWAQLARATLLAEQVSGSVEMSVLFVDEETIAAMNEQYLGHHGPTDVLSFPIDQVRGGRAEREDQQVAEVKERPGTVPLLLGDVVICPSIARTNAPSHTGSFEDEIALLVVHGILHLLGMDHEQNDEAESMEARELELLSAHHPRARKEAT